ncbi:nitroreductase family deazaflavin-dependent oxidoreductase [Actinoplanes sp. KI2]|uniref:nitroreductase family deazaflavin-dependent oxidoreductase n=1 Tax=Actinoplanes sp. KI2 TaxID=2983315 RepID=UPI0021D5D02F|nr:nitroreductase family deazaflavin-dependent oxidoreductase [Actinoplanes sp. KI2]MCU7727065.1 nitroreductase family deazaflavin-dependent oxidoreductase [Actinoplanes sp. KI2]
MEHQGSTVRGGNIRRHFVSRQVFMPFPRTLTKGLRGPMNRMMLRLAGHAAFADLEHIGRRSGQVYHTPVRAFRVRDTVVIGLNFGRRSDWFKNVTKAGSARVRLGRECLDLGVPRVVPAEIGTREIPRLFRYGLRYVARTKECVVLPITMSRPLSG